MRRASLSLIFSIFSTSFLNCPLLGVPYKMILRVYEIVRNGLGSDCDTLCCENRAKMAAVKVFGRRGGEAVEGSGVE